MGGDFCSLQSCIIFFSSHVLPYLRDNFAPRVDGQGWLFPTWCFLGTPVPNQLKINSKYSGGKCKLHFPKFTWVHFALIVFLGKVCTLEHSGLRRSCVMLSQYQFSYGLCNKD